jgi:heme-degrading monooxygenase HmoA
MIARVRTIRLAPGSLVQALEMLRTAELPILRQAPGFVGMVALASLSDSTTGERIEVISLWEGLAALNVSGAGIASDARIMQALPRLAAPLDPHVYEVAQAVGVVGGTVARFISAQLRPGNIDTVVTLFENVVMHAATEQQGFRRGLLLIDRAHDHAISIGLWHSELDLLASEQVGYLRQQIGQFAQVVAAPVVPETLVVAVEG